MPPSATEMTAEEAVAWEQMGPGGQPGGPLYPLPRPDVVVLCSPSTPSVNFGMRALLRATTVEDFMRGHGVLSSAAGRHTSRQM